ncbi:MAG TPA: hypothetical protein VIH96_19095, partial [Paraburkholderia sp.]
VAAGRGMPQHCLESNSSILNVTLLNQTELLGVASHRAALRFVRLNALRVLPMRLAGIGSVSMYWRADSLSRKAVALTLEHLRASARVGARRIGSEGDEQDLEETAHRSKKADLSTRSR